MTIENTEKTNDTITVLTYWVGYYNNGDIALANTVTLANGELVKKCARIAKDDVLERFDGERVTVRLAGYKKAIATLKRDWNRTAKKYGEPRCVKVEHCLTLD